ncbi:MAG: hypothetical protein OXM61_16075 [Candidatus Poribacteria bacterium]|nr:hypothetical protein [Candidatus Poribacteria bacterium]
MHSEQIKNDLYTNHWQHTYSWHGVKMSKLADHYNCSIDDIRALMIDVQTAHPKPKSAANQTTCKTCGAPIVFVNKHPCDPSVHKFIDAAGKVHTGRISHFATCPDADKHRKK